MSEGESLRDMLRRRSKLIIEVARMRKEYPQKIVSIDKNIVAAQLKVMNSPTLLHNSLVEDIEDYKKKNGSENVNFRDFERDKKHMKEVLERLPQRSEDESNARAEVAYSFAKMDAAIEGLEHRLRAQDIVRRQDPVYAKVRGEFPSRQREAGAIFDAEGLSVPDADADAAAGAAAVAVTKARLTSAADSFCVSEASSANVTE